MTTTTDSLTDLIRNRFGGRLWSGAHEPGSGECCILEAVSLCEGRDMTDDPSVLDRPDCRPLNDAPWPSEEARADGMLRLAPLLAAWPAWPQESRVAWARIVALRTVREVLPVALRIAGLESHAMACERAGDLTDSSAAAYAAAYAARAAASAADAAYAAARASAAAAANSHEVLLLAVRIWAEAAEEVAGLNP